MLSILEVTQALVCCIRPRLAEAKLSLNHSAVDMTQEQLNHTFALTTRQQHHDACMHDIKASSIMITKGNGRQLDYFLVIIRL